MAIEYTQLPRAVLSLELSRARLLNALSEMLAAQLDGDSLSLYIEILRRELAKQLEEIGSDAAGKQMSDEAIEALLGQEPELVEDGDLEGQRLQARWLSAKVIVEIREVCRKQKRSADITSPS